MFKLIVLTTIIGIAFGLPHKSLPHGMIPRLDGRIVGGEPVNIEDYPYQISLLYYGSHICGGSIISETSIVTAAHCTYGSSASDLSIRAGSSIKGSGGTVINVRTVNQHPNFNYGTLDYDVSVLTLSNPLKFGYGIQPIPLRTSDPPDGSSAICTGWGALTEGGASPSQLQAVTVPIVNREQCNSAYSGEITARMICAGVPQGGKDACQGDSGGPLASGGFLSGIVSWGYGCARPDYPGVYSDVAALHSFIVENS